MKSKLNWSRNSLGEWGCALVVDIGSLELAAIQKRGRIWRIIYFCGCYPGNHRGIFYLFDQTFRTLNIAKAFCVAEIKKVFQSVK